MVHRCAQSGLIVEHEAEIIMRLSVGRAELERTQKVRNCSIEIALVAERHTKIAVGPGMVGINGERPLVMIDRLVQRAYIAQGNAQTVVDPDMIGNQRKGALKMDNRLIELAQVAVGIAEIGESVDVIWVNGQCPPVRGRSSLQPPLVLESSTEVVVDLRILRVDRQHLLIIADRRLARPARFSKNITEVVVAARMARFDGKNLAIEQLGFRKSAATVVAKRRIEQIGGPTGLSRADVARPLGRNAALSSVHLLPATGL